MKNFVLFITFFLKGGQTKIFVGQTWTNVGQTNAIEFFLNFKFGGANFTELREVCAMSMSM